MRYALPLCLLIGTPALAHHEAMVVSMVPGMMLLAVTASGAAIAAWRRWRRK